jgi:hypothetical protein
VVYFTWKFPDGQSTDDAGTYTGSDVILDSAEKPQECFDRLTMNGKILDDFEPSSVRPEALEG